MPRRPTALPAIRRAATVALLAAAPWQSASAEIGAIVDPHGTPAQAPAQASRSPEVGQPDGDPTLLGRISYYGRKFAGRLTASGEAFDPNAMTMAHPWLPFGTLVRVMTPHAPQGVVLRVNDRGPFHGARVADVSPAAARLLGMLTLGWVPARLEVVNPAAESRTEPSPRNR